MAAPLNVLHVSPAFYPATRLGGPIFSLYGLCNALARQSGLSLRVLTTDAAGPSLDDKLPRTSLPTQVGAGYDVYYCKRQFGRDWSYPLLRLLPKLIDWADVVHLTAVYSFPTLPTLTLARLKGKPVVWSPRGSLLARRQWAGASNVALKWLFERVTNCITKGQPLVLHTTSSEEHDASLSAIPGARATIIRNGVELPAESVTARNWRPGGRLRLLFISRIDPKKGIEFLLKALHLLQGKDVSLEICGTGSEPYVQQVRKLAVSLGVGDRVTFSGHLSGVEKTVAFMRADISILPSHSENFGMVIAESLAHGVPVIASRNTPWADVVPRGCGYWVSNEPSVLAHTIEEALQADLPAMGERGRKWMSDRFDWETIAREMCELYSDLRGAVR